jgi:hypothetical protein
MARRSSSGTRSSALQELVTTLGSAAADSSAARSSAFPTGHIFPRDETQAGAFIAQHPSWDGQLFIAQHRTREHPPELQL